MTHYPFSPVPARISPKPRSIALKLILFSILVISASAGAIDFAVRTRMGNLAIPIPRPDDKSPADAAWEEVATLIALTPGVNVAPPFPETKADWRGYIFWQEFSNRLLRETGLLFYALYPDDARCWIWLEATLKREPQFLNLEQGWRAQWDVNVPVVVDQAALLAWRTKLPEVRDVCIAADSAPESLRVQLWTDKLREAIRAEASARTQKRPLDATRIDFEQIGEALQALGEKFPNNDSELVRITARDFFKYAGIHATDTAAKWHSILKDNTSPLLRDMALSGGNLESLKTSPMPLRFTAVDGREVDLKKLRGKLVLIDFWAATWCGACKVQKPLMKDVYAKYHELGFEIIGIACETKEGDRQFLLDYVKAHEMPWPQFFDGKGMRNEYTLRYGFSGIPQFFLLNKQGLLAVHTSGSQGLRNLEAVVRQQLGLSPLNLGDENKVLGVNDGTPVN